MGSTIEVTYRDGHRQKALLETAGEEQFDISYERLVPKEGSKKKVRETVRETLRYSEIKSAKAVLKF